MAKKVKYLGSADVRVIDKGTDFGGQLADPLSKRLSWNWENNHLLDLEEEGVSQEAIDLILEQDDFRDVTDLKRIPASLGEQIFRGASASSEAEEAPASSKTEEEAPVGGSGGTTTPSGPSTVGGSTTPGTGRGGSTRGTG